MVDLFLRSCTKNALTPRKCILYIANPASGLLNFLLNAGNFDVRRFRAHGLRRLADSAAAAEPIRGSAGSMCQWWIRELVKIWLAVILYYVGIYAGIIGISGAFAIIREGTLSKLGYMIRSMYVKMIIRSILGMGILLTMQSSAQLCLKKASVGIAVFFISVFFSIFCPIESFAKYTIGSWMMIRRDMILSPGCGYNWLHVLEGAGMVFFATILSTSFCLITQRNHW